jgi:transcription elongation factor GreA
MPIMEPEALAKLAMVGSASSLEQEWMNLLATDGLGPNDLLPYTSVLEALSQGGRAPQAESLAWAAIEAIAERDVDAATLTVAGRFLVAVGQGDELRRQVAELYRRVHGRRPSLDRLLAEAGLEGGRPPRRAIRTLEVCLPLSEGDYLAERHDEGAARVERIDTNDWTFQIATPEGSESFSAVALADRYRPAEPDDFRVLRVFQRDELLRALREDPVRVIENLCRRHGGSMGSQTLEQLLVPELFDEETWKGWWSRARTALRKAPQVRLEGRSPYTITYLSSRSAREDTVREGFDAVHDPLRKLALMQSYVTECRQSGLDPDPELLRHCVQALVRIADRRSPRSGSDALLLQLIASQAGEIAQIPEVAEGALRILRGTSKPDTILPWLETIGDDTLIVQACRLLIAARPADWRDLAVEMFPRLQAAACSYFADRLRESGAGRSEFQPIVERIVSDPQNHFDALLWLYDGPRNESDISEVPLSTLLTRVVKALDDCRRDDTVPKETARRVSLRARSVLSARRYEQFQRCLAEIDGSVATVLRMQIRRLDNIGRSVPEDMLRLLSERFPVRDTQPAVPVWAREDILLVTNDGLRRKQEEVDYHVNVRMKENARAIGEAAAHGDLSENSEYKFALEERDLLRARLAQMNSELVLARIIEPNDVPTDQVGVGTHLVLRRVHDDHPLELTLLGPWEADLDSGRLNYRAPLARRLMGRRPGDEVELELPGAEGTYRIIALSSGL